jgi:oligoribonuclease NrnB/cAMP/cGMP phosphodiesterase (DHH superfamily)
MKKDLVIYHDNCVDGFTSAWAAWLDLKERADYKACKYGDVIKVEQHEYDTLYIVDFSFPRDILLEYSQMFRNVVVLDHHKTAQEALENWSTKPDNLTIRFDMALSGAGMTWNWFHTLTPEPWLISYVQDRDLWKFNLPRSKEISAYIAQFPKTFEDYSQLAKDIQESFERTAESGFSLLHQFAQLCESIASNSRPITIYAGDKPYDGLCVNCPGNFASDVGNILAFESGTFGCTYCFDKTGDVIVSLRSIGDYDVSAIAKHYGGGGHKNAAGFKIVSARAKDRIVGITQNGLEL